MKALTKRISLILLALLMIVSAIALSACDSDKRDRDRDDDDDEGQLSGTYTGDGATFVFKGNKVTVSYYGEEMEYEYTINDDEITLTMTEQTIQEYCDNYGYERDELTDDMITMVESFEKGDGYIKIGELKLEKEGADIGGDNSDSGIGNIPSIGGGSLSGTYEYEAYGTTITYTFSDTYVTESATYNGETTTTTGTYEIDGDTLIFTTTYENGSTDRLSYSFEKGDDYIVIEGLTFTRK